MPGNVCTVCVTLPSTDSRIGVRTTLRCIGIKRCKGTMLSAMFLLFFALMAMTPLARCLEQRATIKFLQRSGKSVVQIWRSLQEVFGRHALGRTQVREWFNRFQAGTLETPSTDKKCPGRPRRRLQHRNEVQRLLNQNSRMTIDELSTATGLSRTSVHRLLKKDMKMTKISAKFVPRLLTDEQKAHWVRLCEQNLAEF